MYVLFTGMEGLNAGIRFNSPFALVGGVDRKPLLIEDFFYNTVIGAKYAAGNIGFSLMFAMGDKSSGDYGSKVEAMDLYVGFTMKATDQLSVGVDVTAFDLAAKNNDMRLNAGLKVGFDADPLAASLTFRAGNMLESAMDMDILIGVSFESGALEAGIDIGVYDLLDKGVDYFQKGDEGKGLELWIEPYVGYQVTEALKAGLDLGFYVGLGSSSELSLYAGPYAEWTVFPNAIMKFKYELEYNMDASAIETHDLKIQFKWSF
jgi:hypothetical protein